MPGEQSPQKLTARFERLPLWLECGVLYLTVLAAGVKLTILLVTAMDIRYKQSFRARGLRGAGGDTLFNYWPKLYG